MHGKNSASPDKRRSESETRRARSFVGLRMAKEDRDRAEAGAREPGLSLSAYIASCMLESPITKRRRKPSLDTKLLAQLLAELNKTGSNIAQILRHLNFGDLVLRHEVEEALEGYRDMRRAVIAAIEGRQP